MGVGVALPLLLLALNRWLKGRDDTSAGGLTLAGQTLQIHEQWRVASAEDLKAVKKELEEKGQLILKLTEELGHAKLETERKELELTKRFEAEKREIFQEFDAKLAYQKNEAEAKMSVLLAQNEQLYRLVSALHPEATRDMIGDRLIGIGRDLRGELNVKTLPERKSE